MVNINYQGTFEDIAALWGEFPEGGHEGDYVLVGSTYYGWNKYSRTWEETTISSPAPAEEEEEEETTTPAAAEDEEAPEGQVSANVNYQGSFNTLASAWMAMPNGGQEGDFITINDTQYTWNVFLRQWVVSADEDVVPISAANLSLSAANSTDINYLGTFASIPDVWAFYPEGGNEGEYVIIDNTIYSWGNSSRQWVESENETITITQLQLSPSSGRINYLGAFDALSDVWDAYPEGGYEGDYIHLGEDEEIQVWNKWERNWGDNGDPQTPAIVHQVFAGSLTINYNLTVNGSIFGTASNALKWNNHYFEDYINQPLRTSDDVSFGDVTASSFIRTGGLSAQFLKADGSVDESLYATSFAIVPNTSLILRNGAITISTLTKEALQGLLGIGEVVTTLGGLSNVASAADDVQAVSKILVRQAGASGANAWSLMNLSDVSGTITGITMNGSSVPVANKIANLGTVITSLNGYAQEAWVGEHYIAKTASGAANGVASLDANTKIPVSQLPDAILGQLLYGGMADANALATLSSNAKARLGISANTVTLTNDTGTYGYGKFEGVFFIMSADSNFAGLSLQTGDWLISTGTAWNKIDNTDAVTSVNGRIGAVTVGWNDVKPNGGIVKTDLSQAVQTSLTKADNALPNTGGTLYNQTEGNVLDIDSDDSSGTSLAIKNNETDKLILGYDNTGLHHDDFAGAFIENVATSKSLVLASDGKLYYNGYEVYNSHTLPQSVTYIAGSGIEFTTVVGGKRIDNVGVCQITIDSDVYNPSGGNVSLNVLTPSNYRSYLHSVYAEKNHDHLSLRTDTNGDAYISSHDTSGDNNVILILKDTNANRVLAIGKDNGNDYGFGAGSLIFGNSSHALNITSAGVLRYDSNAIATQSWVENQGYVTSVPTASPSVLGIVKVGTGLSIDGGGSLSAVNLATTNVDNLNVTFGYRQVPGIGDATSATIKALKGKTVVWNQLINKSAFPATYSEHGITFTKNGDGSVDVSGTNDGTDTSTYTVSASHPLVVGHKYLIQGSAQSNANVYLQYYAASQYGGDYDTPIFTAAVNAFNFIGIRVAANAAISGTVKFRPQFFDLTLMFGAGNEPATVAEFRALYPNAYYAYDAGGLVSFNAGIRSRGANNAWANTLPIDITGITSNRVGIFPNGLLSAGSVCDELVITDGEARKAIKRVGRVNLGSLEWSFIAGSPNRFHSLGLSGAQTGNISNILSTLYSAGWGSDKKVAVDNGGLLLIWDSAYADAASFKAAMNGVYLCYELATPVEYTLDNPLRLSYRVENGGTEETVPNGLLSAPFNGSIHYGVNAAKTVGDTPWLTAQALPITGGRIYGDLQTENLTVKHQLSASSFSAGSFYSPSLTAIDLSAESLTVVGTQTMTVNEVGGSYIDFGVGEEGGDDSLRFGATSDWDDDTEQYTNYRFHTEYPIEATAFKAADDENGLAIDAKGGPLKLNFERVLMADNRGQVCWKIDSSVGNTSYNDVAELIDELGGFDPRDVPFMYDTHEHIFLVKSTVTPQIAELIRDKVALIAGLAETDFHILAFFTGGEADYEYDYQQGLTGSDVTFEALVEDGNGRAALVVYIKS